jgi:hypothetical protein
LIYIIGALVNFVLLKWNTTSWIIYKERKFIPVIWRLETPRLEGLPKARAFK